MKPSHFLSLACAASLVAPSASAQEFLILGPGSAWAVSENGAVVAGSDGGGVFRWMRKGGMVSLGGQNSGHKMSADGNVITGNINVGGQQVAGLWTQGTGWVSLGGLPGPGCGSLSSGYGLNADGRVAVGLGWENCKGRAYKWTQATGMVKLGVLGPISTRANCVSPDGKTVGGWDEHSTGARRAAVWFDNGTEQLILVTPTNPVGAGEVWDFSADGSVVVGQGGGAFPNAFRWTAAGGPQDLGAVPGGAERDIGAAYATNADGSMIVGNSGTFFTGYSAFMWTREDGMMRLDFYLAQHGLSIPGGTVLGGATDITGDGRVIVGFTGFGFGTQAFRAQLPPGFKYGFVTSPVNSLTLAGSGSTRIGRTFVATTSNVTGTVAGTLVSAASANFPLLGGVGLVDLSGPLLLLPAAATGGVASRNVPIPNNPGLVGGTVYLQSLAPDASQPAGYALSNGLKLVVTS